MILAGRWASGSQVLRFQLEARANARLDHPHIVPILELGEYEGWHYFTMKLVEGEDLARAQQAGLWPSVSRPDQERIAQLMRQVSGAVHFAHQRGILHRDLKPTNILVDQQGAPYVTDFGLAKLIEETSDLTRSSAVLGTPAYMAPEQAAGKADEITLAADIYSLGAILYELLTGSPVHSGRTSLETVRRVLETEVTPPGRLNPHVADDLAVICLRCLRREPSARYRSAAELEEDLERWLHREPIEARPLTSLERLDYWRQRNPLAATLSALLLLTLLVTGIVSSVLALRMREARDEAREYAADSRQRLTRLLVDNGLRVVEAGDPIASLPWFVAALREDLGDGEREWPHRARIGSLFKDLPELVALWFHERLIQHSAFSVDGRRVATASYDGTVRVWDTGSGREIGPARWHTNDGAGMTLLFHVAFSPDGSRVVSAGNRDARIWDVHSGAMLTSPLTHANEVRFAAFSPDGQHVLTASLDRTARLWDAASGEPIHSALEHEGGVLTASWSLDSRRVASGGRDRIARVWEVGSGRLLMATPPQEGEITQVEFSPDGEQLVATCGSAKVQIWRPADGELLATLRDEGGVRQARFSPDGERLITAGTDRQARIWDWRLGKSVLSLPHRAGGVDWVGWSADGRRVFTACASRMQLWDAESGEALTAPLPHTHAICHAGISADGLSLLTACADGTARLWRPAPAPSPRDQPSPPLRALGPDGRYAVLRTAADRFELWDLRERRRLVSNLPASIGSAYAHAFNQPPTRLALHRDGEVSLFDLSEEEMVTMTTTSEPVRRLGAWRPADDCAIRLSPDGSVIAAQGSLEVRLLDALSGQPLCPNLSHPGGIQNVAFDPAARRLLTVGDDGTARVWSVPEGRLLTGPMRHEDVIVFGAFSPNGKRIVTTGYDGTARVWKAATGRSMGEPLRHGALVMAAEFSPDQRWLATVAAGNSVRLWDLESGRALAPPMPLRANPRYFGFLGAAGPLLTVSDDLQFQLWELPSGRPLNPAGLNVEPRPGDSRVPTSELKQDWLSCLPVDRRSWEELERLSILLSGYRVQGEGGLVPVDVARLREAWARP
jgi:eukaryotic-like serine/threonine-protein kinase